MKTGRRGFLGLLAGIGAAAGVKVPEVKAEAPVTLPVVPVESVWHQPESPRYVTTSLCFIPGVFMPVHVRRMAHTPDGRGWMDELRKRQ